MATTGRPAKYTDEIAKAICEAVAAGVPEVIAAQAAGVARTTLQRWKKKHAAFCSTIKEARAQAIEVRVKRINKAAQGGDEVEVSEKTVEYPNGKTETTVVRKKTAPQWTADAWYLERQVCEQFGLNRLDLKELLNLLRASRANTAAAAKVSQKAKKG